MLRLTSIQLEGTSSRGPFGCKIPLSDGLQVLSGSNGIGKSLLFDVVMWCLGLEVTYGLAAGVNSYFPEAVRTTIKLPEGSAQVLNSAASITISTEDRREYSLWRPIVGGDTKVISVKEEESADLRLAVGSGTLRDERTGFQAWLYRVLKWPRQEILTSDGRESLIYLENLSPFFFLDQIEGWTGIQAQQINRYRQIDIEQAAFEFVLGLNSRLQRRVLRQRDTLGSRSLKAEFESLSESVNSALVASGWEPLLSSHGTMGDILKRVQDLSLTLEVEAKYGWSFVKENERLTASIAAQQRHLVGPRDQKDVRVAEFSTKVLDLKSAKHLLETELRTVREQMFGQKDLVRTIEGRLASAEDLLRLKRDHLGVADRAECPTCHQDIVPETFDINDQQISSVELYISTLQKEKSAVKKSLANTEVASARILANLQRTEAELDFARRQLDAMNLAVDSSQEKIMDVATKVAAAEREIDRNKELAARLSEFQNQLDKWKQKAEAHRAAESAPEPKAEKERLANFEGDLKALLIAQGHNGFREAPDANVRLDDYYVPFVGDRRLSSLGSASDISRTTVAYVLAAARVSTNLGGHHLGLVILDEPLQQNPDTERRRLFIEALERREFKAAPQVLVLTHLKEDEVARLQKKGISVQELGADYLLQP